MRVAELVPGATSTLRRRLRAKQLRTSRDACWRWGGATSRKRDGVGRPAIQVGGRRSPVVHVARVLLALIDRVPLLERRGLEAGHRCGNYWCVNGRHLEWQTRSENEDAKQEFDAYASFAAAVDELAVDG